MNESELMYPIFSQKGANIPRKKIFKGLREMWVEEDNRRTNSELAVVMETTPQALSTWLSEGSNRQPPFWAILRLCYLLDLEIKVAPDNIAVDHRSLENEPA